MTHSATPASTAPYPRERITAGILAGGRATRMGGIDKGLVPLAGRCMVEYVIAALRPQAAQVLINANRNLAEYGRFGAHVVADREQGYLGPLSGMASMMAQAGDGDWLLTAPCDSPLVSADYGLRLWRAAEREGAEIAVAHSGERLQPVFALLRCALRPSLEAYLDAGERKIDRWYRQQRLVEVDFSDCADMFINVNTLEERDALALKLPHRRA